MGTMRGAVWTMASVVVHAASVAAAETPPKDALRPLDLGSLSQARQAGVEMGVADVSGELTILTLVLVGDVNLTDHFKLHGRVPFFVSRSADGGSQTGLGNPGLGGRFIFDKQAAGGTLRLGVGMTGSVAAGGERAAIGSAPSIPWRIAEWAHDTWALRVDTGVRYEVGWAFAQLEAGFDNLLRTSGDELALASLLEIGAGLGVRATDDLTVVSELLAVTDALRGSGGRADWLPALSVGARYGGASLAVAGKIHVPIGNGLAGYPIGFGIDLLARL